MAQFTGTWNFYLQSDMTVLRICHYSLEFESIVIFYIVIETLKVWLELYLLAVRIRLQPFSYGLTTFKSRKSLVAVILLVKELKF